ncbi:MAG: hypothetical protein WC748_01995 [Legionellales bacterium]
MFNHLWQKMKENSTAVVALGGSITTSASLYAFGASSADSSADHTDVGQWSAWMASNLTQAIETGNNTLIEYVIGELNDMEKHCEKASASKHDDSVVQNVFATAFLVAGAAYAGKKVYDAYSSNSEYAGINNDDGRRNSL